MMPTRNLEAALIDKITIGWTDYAERRKVETIRYQEQRDEKRSGNIRVFLMTNSRCLAATDAG